MPKPIVKGRLSTAMKMVAGLLSAGTAAVTVFTFARSYGLIGAPAPAALTVGSLGVSWIGLAPLADTATSLGDTVRFAATVTDENGTALYGATIHWSSDDSTIVQAVGGGRIVARHPGTASIVAAAGERIARARVVVRQRVAALRVEGDSALTLAEDEHRRLAVRALDARGNVIPPRRALWSSADTTIVTVDSLGLASARGEGRGELAVDVDGVVARVPVAVVALPASLTVTAGTGQRALAGAALAQPVAVRLVSTHGRPIADAVVRFRTSDGRGGADPALAVTDARGIARTSWTLGTLPGRQRLVATADRLDSAALVVAEAEPLAANTRVVNLDSTLVGLAGEPLADTVAVRATDTLGRALADVPVSWLAEGRAVAHSLADRTDSLGEARAIWTLAPSVGTQRLRVRLGAGLSVPLHTVRAVATAGAPASIAVVAGEGQKARVGSALSRRVVLRVADAAGNPVPGATLSLRASAGELADSMPVTDSAGQVHVKWTMPRTVGTPRLTAHVAGVAKSLELSAAAVAAPAANVTFTEPERAPVAGKPFGKSVDVTVTDVYGNPIAGAVVTFRARSGTAAPLKVATDRAGVARTRWTLGTRRGEQTLSASVAAGEAAARSALTVTVGETDAAASSPPRPAVPARHARSKHQAHAERGR